MICVIHGTTGGDNHSEVVGAVEATSNEARQALKKFFQTYGVGPLNRARFNQFVLFSGLQIVPVIGIDYDSVAS
jgi:hypothetical protein